MAQRQQKSASHLGASSAGAPLIAVSTSELRSADRTMATEQGEPPQQEMVLGLKYLQAIEHAGAIPVVIPPLRGDLLASLLGRVSGVCLSGGPDLDPVAYGADRHELLGPTWRELDIFELELARVADARRLPIMAICRGMQVLNVARGGTLHQHLPDVFGEQIVHRQSQPGREPTHQVAFDRASQVTEILRCQDTHVNSFHHQALATLGEGLVVTGSAADGTIESVEAVDRDFVLGVQWHAEYLVHLEPQAALFGAFVDAAREFELAAAGLRRAA